MKKTVLKFGLALGFACGVLSLNSLLVMGIAKLAGLNVTFGQAFVCWVLVLAYKLATKKTSKKRK